MVQPVTMGSVESQVGAIEQLIDGGFPSALAFASTMAATTNAQAPTVSNEAVGLPTSVVIGSQQPTPSQRSQSAGPSLVNAPMAPAATAQGLTGATGQAQLGTEAVAIAERYVGVPYLWGGASPSGFDCSGLVQYVYGQLGVSLPRTSQQQATVGTPVPSLAQAQPGDLVFFAGSDGTPQSPGHVGIYIGNGLMVDAPYTGSSVQVQPVGNPVAIRAVTSLPSGAAPNQQGPNQQAAGQYAALFASATARYGLPPGLLQAVATTESNMAPQAVSSAGAEGMMQLMPGTASSMGVNPFDPVQAVPAAASLLSGYLARFGSLPLALAAYNAGPQAVTAYGGVPPYAQTQNYVSSVIANMGGKG